MSDINLRKVAKYAAIVFIAILAIIFAQNAYAQDCGVCFRFQTDEAQKFCKAKCNDDSSWCGHIRDRDVRYHCYGEVEGDPDRCDLVRDSDLREECYIDAR